MVKLHVPMNEEEAYRVHVVMLTDKRIFEQGVPGNFSTLTTGLFIHSKQSSLSFYSTIVSCVACPSTVKHP